MTGSENEGCGAVTGAIAQLEECPPRKLEVAVSNPTSTISLRKSELGVVSPCGPCSNVIKSVTHTTNEVY